MLPLICCLFWKRRRPRSSDCRSHVRGSRSRRPTWSCGTCLHAPPASGESGLVELIAAQWIEVSSSRMSWIAHYGPFNESTHRCDSFLGLAWAIRRRSRAGSHPAPEPGQDYILQTVFQMLDNVSRWLEKLSVRPTPTFVSQRASALRLPNKTPTPWLSGTNHEQLAAPGAQMVAILQDKRLKATVTVQIQMNPQ